MMSDQAATGTMPATGKLAAAAHMAASERMAEIGRAGDSGSAVKVGRTADDGKAAALWQDYRLLTREMLKFLTKREMDLFYDLMKQREKLQAAIEETADAGFKASPAGRSLLAEIQEVNQDMLDNLRLKLAKMHQRRRISDAYGCTPPGSRLNWQR